MQPADLRAVETFSARLHEEAIRTAQGLLPTVQSARAVCGNDKRRFAVDWVNRPETPKLFRPMLFSIWDGQHPVETVLKVLAANTITASRIDDVRGLVAGLDWRRFAPGLALVDF